MTPPNKIWLCIYGHKSKSFEKCSHEIYNANWEVESICENKVIEYLPLTVYTELEKKLGAAIRFYQKYINKLDDGTQFCHDEIQELNKELEALEILK